MLRQGASGAATPTTATPRVCGEPGRPVPALGAERQEGKQEGKRQPCPAAGTLSVGGSSRGRAPAMCWPGLMDWCVRDSSFRVTHGFVGPRQCHGKYFFNNSKDQGEGGGELGNTKENSLPHSCLKLVSFLSCS